MSLIEWVAYPLTFFVVAAFVVGFRWLVSLSRKVNEHAERIARMEGRQDRP